jgi:hypothetical protein
MISSSFGIWTYEKRSMQIELTKKSFFYVVDYYGDGICLIYKQDTIRVYYNDYVSVGILKYPKGTFENYWDSGITNYVKWKRTIQHTAAIFNIANLW